MAREPYFAIQQDNLSVEGTIPYQSVSNYHPSLDRQANVLTARLSEK